MCAQVKTSDNDLIGEGAWSKVYLGQYYENPRSVDALKVCTHTHTRTHTFIHTRSHTEAHMQVVPIHTAKLTHTCRPTLHRSHTLCYPDTPADFTSVCVCVCMCLNVAIKRTECIRPTDAYVALHETRVLMRLRGTPNILTVYGAYLEVRDDKLYVVQVMDRAENNLHNMCENRYVGHTHTHTRTHTHTHMVLVCTLLTLREAHSGSCSLSIPVCVCVCVCVRVCLHKRFPAHLVPKFLAKIIQAMYRMYVCGLLWVDGKLTNVLLKDGEPLVSIAARTHTHTRTESAPSLPPARPPSYLYTHIHI